MNTSAFEQAVEHVRTELTHLRTGRANAALVEDIQVEAYGSMMTLKGLASIQNLDARTLTIEPWDKSVLKAIEKAIIVADLGLSPVVDGSGIRLSMPQMTEESRKHLVKTMKEKLEEGRVAVRRVREELRDEIKEQELPEDSERRAMEELEKTTREFTEQIERMGEEKEKEIMTV